MAVNLAFAFCFGSSGYDCHMPALEPGQNSHDESRGPDRPPIKQRRMTINPHFLLARRSHGSGTGSRMGTGNGGHDYVALVFGNYAFSGPAITFGGPLTISSLWAEQS